MSVLMVFAVFDKAAGAYMRPFFLPARGQALRGFMDAIADPSSEIAKHADDYTLFELGSFNEATGEFDCGDPQKVASGHELTPKISDDGVHRRLPEGTLKIAK